MTAQEKRRPATTSGGAADGYTLATSSIPESRPVPKADTLVRTSLRALRREFEAYPLGARVLVTVEPGRCVDDTADLVRQLRPDLRVIVSSRSNASKAQWLRAFNLGSLRATFGEVI